MGWLSNLFGFGEKEEAKSCCASSDSSSSTSHTSTSQKKDAQNTQGMRAVILGNGPAGVIAAETLRRSDPNIQITMVGCENEPPYSRMAIPYLLIGNIEESGTWLRKTEGHFANLRVDEVRAKAIALDDKKRTVKLDDGQNIAYDQLLICTGSHPIQPPIPGIDLPQVHACWTLDDARGIMSAIKPGSRVLQIGAGFIGCIIMEALASRDIELTIVEMGSRMVPRMMTPKAGDMIRQWVEQKGIKVFTDTRVEKLEAASDGSLTAYLSNGETMQYDQVIASAGVKPNIDFLKGSRIETEQGILVDESMKTNIDGVYAAGDVAEAVEFATGERLVNAIQPNAADQANIAATNMAASVSSSNAKAISQGSLAINVLDTMGLISSSFGQWEGAGKAGHNVELIDEDKMRYISLQFKDNVLIGATAIGLTDHVGALRGLIQSRIKLGEWEEHLTKNPLRFFEAYVANTQPTSLN